MLITRGMTLLQSPRKRIAKLVLARMPCIHRTSRMRDIRSYTKMCWLELKKEIKAKKWARKAISDKICLVFLYQTKSSMRNWTLMPMRDRLQLKVLSTEILFNSRTTSQNFEDKTRRTLPNSRTKILYTDNQQAKMVCMLQRSLITCYPAHSNQSCQLLAWRTWKQSVLACSAILMRDPCRERASTKPPKCPIKYLKKAWMKSTSSI